MVLNMSVYHKHTSEKQNFFLFWLCRFLCVGGVCHILVVSSKEKRVCVPEITIQLMVPMLICGEGTVRSRR